MTDTIRIGGIKLSGKLVQIDFRESEGSEGTLAGLLRRIRTARINLPHLHQEFVGKEKQTTLCVAEEDYLRLKNILDVEFEKTWKRILPSVRTLTIFPHSSSIGFFAKLYRVLCEEDIPVLGVSTSVSALVIHTEHAFLNQALAAILTVCELPENHSPFHPDFKLQQVER